MLRFKTHYSLIALAFLLTMNSHAQSFLNGNFENTTTGVDQINISNAAFNGFMANTIAFGPAGNMDIINSSTYCGFRESGCFYIAFTGIACDAVSMQLSAPLAVGTTYNIAFWDKACTAFSCGPLPMEIGLSTVNNAFGTNIYTAPLAIDLVWTQRTFSFVAPNNGQYITIRMNAGSGCNWVQIDNFSFAPFTASVVCSPLPIELISFDAKAENNIVHLQWKTATETNNNYFTIERSKDAIEFEEVKIVKGAGNSNSSIDYSDYDLTPFAGTSYYRLRQTDFDKNISYSDIKTVTLNSKVRDIVVFPNPSNGTFKLASKNGININSIKLFDLLGKEVSASLESESENSVKIAGLDAGLYFLSYNDGVNKLEQKVVVEAKE